MTAGGASVLLFGPTGQVGIETLRRANQLAPAQLVAVGRDRVDLTDAAGVEALILAARPALVINASAHTEVDKAESEPELADAVNAQAPAAMAHACAVLGIPLLHISTDYVFDGDKPSGAYAEDDATHPVSAYGRSKEAGERLIRQANPRHIILRTAWVFSAHRKNFVKTMLRLAETRDTLGVVNDQWGGPTPAADIAQALVTMARRLLAGETPGFGTFHFCGAPAVTWCQFAQAVFDAAGLAKSPQVNPITADQYPLPAKRPANSRLDCSKLARIWGIEQPDWRDGLRAVLAELKTENAS
jgi:dTDP-4-dehydrorhamnose reductase